MRGRAGWGPLAAAALIVAATACSFDGSGKSFDGGPQPDAPEQQPPDAGPDAEPGCTTSAMCPTSEPICDGTALTCRACAAGETGDTECAARDGDFPLCEAGACIACRSSFDDCPLSEPICDDTDRACRACTDDAAGNTECATRDSDFPLCDDGVCVGCREDSDCSATTPVCDQAEQVCRACTAHTECDSGACNLGTGACVAAADIIYTDSEAGEDDADCGDTPAKPCRTLTGTDGALAKVGNTRRTIVLAAGTYAESVTINTSVTIIGPAEATISPTVDDAPGIVVSKVAAVGAVEVTIDGISVTGVTSDQERTAGVRCQSLDGTGSRPNVVLRQVFVVGNDALGVNATRCDLSILEATISNNDLQGVASTNGPLTIERSTISGNEEGGISFSEGTFRIVNNFIVGNGSPAATLGGVHINGNPTGGNGVLAFNTIADNQSDATVGLGGVSCTVTTALPVSGNIVRGNSPSQVAGNCTWTYSNIEGGLAGTGNINSNPLFVGGGDYHLQAGSPCINAADPASTIDLDFDGDPRPQGGGFDIGADEFVPAE